MPTKTKEKPYKFVKEQSSENRYTMNAIIKGRAVSISAEKEPKEKRSSLEKRLWAYLQERYN